MSDLIDRQAAIDALHMHLMYRMGTYSNKKRLDDWINGLPSAQETHEERTETHARDCISRQAAIKAVECLPNCYNGYSDTYDKSCIIGLLEDLPSAQPQTEWNNHTVACLLAELFGDACACNYNGIDEWLPEKCEVIDACPNPVGVACWEQFLKHRAERRTDGKST